MSKRQKRMLLRIIIAPILMIAVSFVPVKGLLRFLLYMIPYLIIGYDILKKAVLGIWNRQVLDENFLMAVATIGAIIIALNGRGDYVEAIAVMLFYQIGELFQSFAVGKSRKSISELMDIRPSYANIEKNGVITKASPEDIDVGSIITVLPGEKVPIDGVLAEGRSLLDTSALTGESLPKSVNEGDEIISGSINIIGVLKIRTTKLFEESTVSKILELVENASSRKSRSEKFISRFAAVYTPFVCASALILAFVVPFVPMLFTQSNVLWSEWIYRALTFLVVSCPCALVISIPLSFFAGIGCASRAGVLVKGSNFLEALSKAQCVVFDKTGTLTQGVFSVIAIHAENSDEKLIELASLAESASTHPIARSIITLYKSTIDQKRVGEVYELSGKGICALVDGKEVLVGNSALMKEKGVEYKCPKESGTVVYAAVDREYEGCFVISDRIKENSKSAVSALKKAGIKKTAMLTGDRADVAVLIGKELGIDEIYSELLPNEKVEKLEKLLEENGKKGTVIFVGDGINDAPVISRADIGVAMGALGSDAAIEAADVVLMEDDPMQIPKAIKISKKCMGIVYQNSIFAIGVKLACLILAAAGITNMWIAIFADVGVMLLAVLNALRAMKS